MKKIPYIPRAILAMLAGVGVVMVGALVARGGETWLSCLGVLFMLVGLPLCVAGVMLLTREQWVGGIAPGRYDTLTCPHCGGVIHLRTPPAGAETSLRKAIDCPYCGKSFTPQ
jgi:hypothetical protein